MPKAWTCPNCAMAENVPEKPWKGICCKRCFNAKTDKKKCKCKCQGEHHGESHQRDS